MNKKAQAISNGPSMLTMASVLFVVVIFVLVVGASIVTNMQTTVSRDSISVTNESDSVTLLWGNNTNMSLNNPEVSVSSVYNCSTGADFTTIGSGNYTVFSDSGKIQGNTNATFPHDDDPVCVNYTYSEQNAAFNTSRQGEQGVLVFSDYLGLIATVIILVVIVGLLIGVIVIFKRRT